MLSLKDRGVLVVGGRRIGAQVIGRLADEGANIAVTYRNSLTEAQKALDAISDRVNRTCLVQGDITREDDIVRMVDEAARQLGNLSFLVNLASDYERTPFDQLDGKAWDRGMAAARGNYLLGLHASRQFMKNDGPTRGHLVFFGDWAAAETPYADYLPYLTAKAAIHFMTRGFALELASHGILVNAVAPGPTMRPPDISEVDWQQGVVEKAPLRRESSPAEIAEVITTLLKSETITGEIIRIDSGRHLAGP